ncbi:hypothetical protein QEH52_08350 [Coraliomargarita sp. SDUM461003]|uniref:PEP-CTERM protein-sorting domain-containing protein n=1 Tax=Thalassobacterium maritimum TaxID=3041265 RepID=A0ABU1ATU7_9BACT|nr:hypothetical protein [Coraliomargarita sp. SDUM461003]MDQ8207516.1 hypothetical protein [Coraliomargarita sp. SDUM461003]
MKYIPRFADRQSLNDSLKPSLATVSGLALAACGLAAPALHAQSVTQVNSLEAGIGWNAAASGGDAIWSDGLAASGTKDYVVGSGFTLRTPIGTSTFAGNSLTIEAGGQLLLKPNNNDRVHTVNDLILNGGQITHGQPARTIAYQLAGSITLTADSTYDATGSDYRRATFSASISGSSTFSINLGSSDDLTISSASNTFSGEWFVSQADSGSVSDFFATGNGALGNADVTIGSGINFDVDYDINNTTKALNLDGIMILDQDHTFGMVQIDGDTLAAGTYSFEDLNSSYDAFFVDGGTGSLTVVPEPSYFALSLAILAMVGFSRRSRK